MTDKDKQFLHDALEYLAKNQIELNYTFPTPNPTRLTAQSRFMPRPKRLTS